MNNYSNSIKNREEKENKKVEKVVKGKAVVKKKSEMSKIASTMIAEEAKSIKDYAIYDVIIPALKDGISQLVKGCIDMMFYGEVRSTSNSRGRYGTNATRVSYRDYYEERRDPRRTERRASFRQSYDDIEFDTREDAEEVLDRMDELIEQYGIVTVGDLFDLAGVTGNGYTDQNYGWTSVASATIERDRHGGYFIKMTRPSPIR